ncbi:MAG TPA: DNA cytosine methyltransferase, partial [Phycisphaerae bacterium]|nr:DNA cytosine methyltransferase [Phycisphaerae bacterium]
MSAPGPALPGEDELAQAAARAEAESLIGNLRERAAVDKQIRAQRSLNLTEVHANNAAGAAPGLEAVRVGKALGVEPDLVAPLLPDFQARERLRLVDPEIAKGDPWGALMDSPAGPAVVQKPREAMEIARSAGWGFDGIGSIPNPREALPQQESAWPEPGDASVLEMLKRSAEIGPLQIEQALAGNRAITGRIDPDIDKDFQRSRLLDMAPLKSAYPVIDFTLGNLTQQATGSIPFVAGPALAAIPAGYATGTAFGAVVGLPGGLPGSLTFAAAGGPIGAGVAAATATAAATGVFESGLAYVEFYNKALELEFKTGETFDRDVIRGAAVGVGIVNGTIGLIGGYAFYRISGGKTLAAALTGKTTEAILLDKSLRPYLASLGRRFVKASVSEGAEETSQETTPVLVGKLIGLNDDTFEQSLARIGEAGLVGTVVGGSGVVVASPVMGLVEKRVLDRRAVAQKQMLDRMVNATQSPLAQEIKASDPSLLREWLASEMARNGRDPNLYLTGAQLTEYFQTEPEAGTLEELYQSMPELAVQVEESLIAGTLIQIPMADYATYMGEHHTGLVDKVRFGLSQRSMEEIQAAQTQEKAELEAYIQALSDAEASGAFNEQTQAERVQDQLTRQYAKTRGFGLYEAKLNAALRVSHATMMVETGSDPDALTRLENNFTVRDDAVVQPTLDEALERVNLYGLLDQIREGTQPELTGLTVRPILSELIPQGVDPEGSLAGELLNMGITPQSAPGLYKAGGLSGLDEFDLADHPLLLDLPRDSYGRPDINAVLDVIREELAGIVRRTDAELAAIEEMSRPREELRVVLDQLGIDLAEVSNEEVAALLGKQTDTTELFQTEQADAKTLATAALDSISIPDAERGHLLVDLLEAPAVTDKVKVEDVARLLESRGGLLDGNDFTPGNVERLSSYMAVEILHALARSGNAIEWYRRTIQAMQRTLARIYPEIATDPNMRAALNMALAITSGGIDVGRNLIIGTSLYETFRETGKFPIFGEGKQSDSMQESFRQVNDLIDKLGGIGEVAALFAEYKTVRELKETYGIADNKGELIDEVVPMSLILGPKIGRFYQNLQGNFKELTVDLWFSRMWGRYVGQMTKRPDAKIMEKRYNRFLSKLTRGRLEALFPGNDIDPSHMVHQNEALFALAQDILAIDKARKHDRSNKRLNPLLLAAKSLAESYAVVAAPGDYEGISEGQTRKYQRAVVERTIERLAEYDIEMTPASVQATVWYPEKELFAHLGARDGKAAPTDYATAAEDFVAQREAAASADVVQPDARGRGERRGASSGSEGNAEGVGDTVAPPAKAAVGEQADTTELFQTAPVRVATVFSGAGTIEGALEGVETVAAREYSPAIIAQYNAAHGTSFDVADATATEIEDLAGAEYANFSPVCKNCSKAKTYREFDENDRRSADAVSRLIATGNLPVVTVENVPAYADTALFAKIADALDAGGYTWDIVQHDAADYGAPMTRKRMLVRAVKSGTLPALPEQHRDGDWWQVVKDLVDDAPDDVVPPVESERLQSMAERGLLDFSVPVITMGGSGFRNTWAAASAGGVAPTLKAAHEKPRIILPDGRVKVVTPRMMARLMGLPDSYAVPDNGTLAKLVIGNGIHGSTTRALVQPLVDTLRASEQADTTELLQSETAAGRVRASLQTDADLTTITETYTKWKDKSSPIHEGGHYFFHSMLRAIRTGQASQRMVTDFRTALGWLGQSVQKNRALKLGQMAADAVAKKAKTTAPVLTMRDIEAVLAGEMQVDVSNPAMRFASVGVHEVWADGFLEYVREGVAPTVELQSAFRTFARWLVKLFTGGQLGVALDPDMRDVYARLLATDVQIERAKSQPGVARALTSDMEWLGAENAAALEAAWRNSEDHSREGMVRELMRERAKELYDAYKADLAQAREQAAADINAQPAVLLKYYLQNRGRRLGDDGPADEGVRRLDIDALERIWPGVTKIDPKTGRYILAGGGKHGLFQRDGADPDAVAREWGFRSADKMIRELAKLGNREADIEEEAQRRMREKYGEILDDEAAMNELALEQFESDEQGRYLEHELRLLAMQARQFGIRETPQHVARQMAQRIIARKTLRELRPHVYRQAKDKAARAVLEAVARQDWAGAHGARVTQLLNHYLLREAKRRKELGERGHDFLQRFNRKSVRQAVGKAGEIVETDENGERINEGATYLAAIDGILDQYEFRGITKREAERRVGLRQFIDQKIAEAQAAGDMEPNFGGISEGMIAEARRIPWRDLTVEQFEDVVAAVRNLERQALLKNKLLTAQDRRDFAEFKEEAIDNLERNRTRKAPPSINPNRAQESAVNKVDRISAHHRKLRSLLNDFDGGRGGIWWDTVVRTMDERGTFEQEQKVQAGEALGELFMPMLTFDERLKGTVENATQGFVGVQPNLHKVRVIPGTENRLGGGIELSREEQLMALLNMGNAGNLQRLMSGYDWTKADVDAIKADLAPADFEWAQKVWDYFDTFWPQIEAQQKRLTGTSVGKIEATPFVSPHGQQMRGGYMPIKGDIDQQPGQVSHADPVQEVANLMRSGGYVSAVTRDGYAKARASKVIGKKLKLNFSVVFNHVSEVIHGLAWHEWLVDTNRIFRDADIAQAIYDTQGRAKYDTIRDALTKIALGSLPNDNAMGKFYGWLRKGSSITGMALSTTTALLQPTGIAQSIEVVGAKWIARGLQEWQQGALRQESTTEWIYAQSALMKHRGTKGQSNIIREVGELQAQVGQPGLFPDLMDAYFWTIIKMQQQVDVPTWIGAYLKEMEEGSGDKARAIALADSAVVDSQGSGQLHDQSQVQRDYPLFTNYYSYANTYYNLQA